MKKLLVLAALGASLLILPLSDGNAACGKSKRISDADAGCLDGKIIKMGREYGYQAQNTCHEWGKVVAKVDIKNGPDKTWHLTTSAIKWGSTSAYRKPRSITCCSDLSDLCSKSDLLTPDGCKTQYQKSPAHGVCRNEDFSVSGENCVVYAECPYLQGRWFENEVTIHYLETKALFNCTGSLLNGNVYRC